MSEELINQQPELLDALIDILQENRVEKEKRFILLKKAYILKETKKGTNLRPIDLYYHVNEVDRLHKIGASQLEIDNYIKNIKV